MIGPVYLEGGIFHENREYGSASAGTEVTSLSKGSFSLRCVHYFNDIWHERIISHNLRLVLVENIAKDYVNHGVALAELIKEGNTGLSHALNNFELEGGSRFSAYAARCIRHSILRAIMNQSEARCVPGDTKEVRPIQKVSDPNIHLQQMG